MAKDVVKIIEESLQKVIKLEEGSQAGFTKVLRKFQKELEKNVSTLDLDQLQNVATAYQQTQDMLEKSGYSAEVGEMLNEQRQEILAVTFNQYKEIFNKVMRFNDDSLEILQTMKQMDALKFSRLGKDVSDRISDQVLRMQFDPTISKARIRKAILDDIDDGFIFRTLKTTAHNIETEVRTATSSFYTQANVQLATDNGRTKLRYSGNIIPTSREFCIKYLNQIKTLEEWDKLNDDPLRKGQPDPVSVFRGGYKCRHTLSAVA